MIPVFTDPTRTIRAAAETAIFLAKSVLLHPSPAWGSLHASPLVIGYIAWVCFAVHAASDTANQGHPTSLCQVPS